jgi:outer membrane protein insertion porin family
MNIFRKFLIAFYCLGLLVASPAVAASASASSALSGLEVDEINLLGVTVFSSTDLEKVIEVSVGERLDRTKIVQTAKNIQDLYHGAGYEGVKIETRLTQRTAKAGGAPENVLEIVVTEGKPTRIAEIAIDYDTPAWEEKLESASAKIGLKPGDIYDREKLLNGFRSMQDSLTTWDFLSPKVDESVVEQVAPPTTPESQALVPTTARWVRVRVKVQLGDRVNFAYRGNVVFPNSQLSSWIEEQRLLGFSQDYIERIRGRFEEEYRKLGYDRVKVEIFTFEDRENQRRKVIYSFTEGPRVELDRIDFDGNAVFDQTALHDQFMQQASPSVSQGYYVAKDVEQSAQVLIEWLKSQGYLAAKLVSISRSYHPDGTRVDVVIYVYEGEQTIVDSVNFPGLTVFAPSQLTPLLGNDSGKPLNLYSLNEGLEKVKLKYRERGYLDIKITTESTNRLVVYSQENRLAVISLELEEGIQYRVSHIEVEGLHKTRLETLTRELSIHEGDVLSEREWYRSEAKLRRLGIFATASIKAYPDPVVKDAKILRILVEEGSPGLVAGGVGLRNDLGGRAFGQIQYSNLWGKNQTISFTANANRRFKGFGADLCASTQQLAQDPGSDHCFIEFDGTVGYVWPWFTLGETTFRPSFSVERTQFRNFDADTYTLKASWERSLIRSWGLSGTFTYSLELVKQYDANVDTDNQQLRIGSVSPTLILDRRDNPLAPTKGTYHTLQFDLARPLFGSQNSPDDGHPPIAYWRMQFRNDAYVPLPRGIDVFLSFRTGLEYNLARPPDGVPQDQLGSGYSIPLIKQYTLGGVGSLRGFDEQSLYVDPNTAVRGSITYVNYRAQIDLPFAGAMKFGPFVDAANLNLDHYTFGALRFGVGAGFHYKSPVGPVNFDIGENIHPHPGEDSYKLDFSIGNI